MLHQKLLIKKKNEWEYNKKIIWIFSYQEYQSINFFFF